MKKLPFAVLAATLSLCTMESAMAASTFSVPPENKIEVVSQGLNVRSGPGVEYKIITEVRGGTELDVLGKLGEWYVVQLSDGTVGVLYNQYVKITDIREPIITEGDADQTPAPISITGTDMEILFGLTNQSRVENQLPMFQWDDKLNQIAQLKAEDMVMNNYFDHHSPTYGTPFKMLKEMGIVYKGASENLLSNLSMESAHETLMASPAHRGNILSPRFNKMGIGIAQSNRYGKIIVQLFIEE